MARRRRRGKRNAARKHGGGGQTERPTAGAPSTDGAAGGSPEPPHASAPDSVADSVEEAKSGNNEGDPAEAEAVSAEPVTAGAETGVAEEGVVSDLQTIDRFIGETEQLAARHRQRLESLLLDDSVEVTCEFVLDGSKAMQLTFLRDAPFSDVLDTVQAAFEEDDLELFYEYGEQSELRIRNADELGAALISYLGAPMETFIVRRRGDRE